VQCAAESPLLKDLYAQYKDQGVVVIGISLDEDVKPVQEMVTTKGLSWPQILDADKSIRKLYNVKGTPTYYLFDREGKIAAKDVPSFKRLSAALANLFKQ
jgi:peroxiredoxin